MASVSPISKKGDKLNPGNYVHISLTAIPCNLQGPGGIDQGSFTNHFVEQGLLSDEQHGFRPRRPCTSQLLQFLEDVSSELEHANPVDIIYLDFQKAIDSVPHHVTSAS